MHAHQQSLQNTHSLEPFVVLKPRQILTFWVWSRAIDLFYQLPALSNLTLTISWGTMSEQLTDCVWWFARNGISCSYFIPSKAWQVNLEALQTNFELVSPQRHPPPAPQLVSPGSRSFGIQYLPTPEFRAGVNQQPSMHQLRMRPFKLFWWWTKNTSSSRAQGIFSPLICPKIFPSYLPTSPPIYLPQLISCSLHLQSSVELLSLSSTEFATQGLRKVESSTLKEWGEEKVRGALHPKCRSKRRKVSSLPSLHFLFPLCCIFFFLYVVFLFPSMLFSFFFLF
jgi:hypothetical protein